MKTHRNSKNLNKKKILNAAVLAALLFYAYFVSWILPRQTPTLDAALQLSRSLIHTGIVILWLASIKRRILQRSVRSYLLAVSVLMIFWLYIRAVKWYFLPSMSLSARYCWYGYYVPIILIPLFGVFITEYIGQTENYEMPKRMRFLYLPALVLIVLIFTNDFHRLAFDFPGGIKYFSSNYTYQIVYYLVMIWVVSISFFFVSRLLQKCRAPGNWWLQRTPFLIVTGAIIVWIIYYLRIMNYDLVCINCFIIILLLESCIQSGLIRSNTKYGVLFGASTIDARIIDDEYHICFTSDNAGSLDEMTMRQAEHGPVNLGNKRLGSAKISHGHVFWWDDITEINRFTKKLEETGKKLSENNDLLRAELELRENNLRMAEKNRLYDRIAEEVSIQLDKLESLLSDVSGTSETKNQLVEICIISAYIKRRSNLLLMSENTDAVPAKELEFCLRESMDNLRLAGILCSLDSVCEGKAPAKYLVYAYDLAEQVFEQIFCKTEAILIKLRISGGSIFLRLQTDCRGPVLLEGEVLWKSLGGSIKFTEAEDILWIELYLEGGMRV